MVQTLPYSTAPHLCGPPTHRGHPVGCSLASGPCGERKVGSDVVQFAEEPDGTPPPPSSLVSWGGIRSKVREPFIARVRDGPALAHSSLDLREQPKDLSSQDPSWEAPGKWRAAPTWGESTSSLAHH